MDLRFPNKILMVTVKWYIPRLWKTVHPWISFGLECSTGQFLDSSVTFWSGGCLSYKVLDSGGKIKSRESPPHSHRAPIAFLCTGGHALSLPVCILCISSLPMSVSSAEGLLCWRYCIWYRFALSDQTRKFEGWCCCHRCQAPITWPCIPRTLNTTRFKIVFLALSWRSLSCLSLLCVVCLTVWSLWEGGFLQHLLTTLFTLFT